MGVRGRGVFFRLSVGIFLLTGCGGEASVDLTVKLRTDYQPLREFLSAEVIVDSEPQNLIAQVDGQYVRPGQELAFFEGLAPSDKRGVTVRLKRLGGAELISSTVFIEHHKDLVITIAITRDCGGVTCGPVEGQDQRCLPGVCVDARCITGSEPFCSNINARCNDDSGCTRRSTLRQGNL